MIRRVSRLALAAAAALALPAAAQAGTATTTSTASFNVAQQCAVTGATIVVGTYTTNQTWMDIAKEIGYEPHTYGTLIKGTRGTQYVNYGSILCSSGTPYTIAIRGNYLGYVSFVMNGKRYHLAPWVKKIGNEIIPDYVPSVYPGLGMDPATMPVSATGTGVQQPIVGSFMYIQDPTVSLSDPLLPGKYVDPLTYTLTF